MAHVVTLIVENIFVIIGLALYAGLVYYMFTKILNKHFGKRPSEDKTKKSASRKNFSKHVVAPNKFAGNDFTNHSS